MCDMICFGFGRGKDVLIEVQCIEKTFKGFSHPFFLKTCDSAL